MSRPTTTSLPLTSLIALLILLIPVTLISTVIASKTPIRTSPLISLSGTIVQPDDDIATNLAITVASAVDGSIIETAPIISRKFFVLHNLPQHEGRHLISVIGSTHHEYNSIVATIRNGELTATFSRSIRKHAIMYPVDRHLSDRAPLLHFHAGNPTRFDRRGRWNGWKWWMVLTKSPGLLWRNKFYVTGAFAVAFLLGFPHIFHKLPPEMREELTGEKEPDLGDPNKVVKTLLGEEAFSTRKDNTMTASDPR